MQQGPVLSFCIHKKVFYIFYTMKNAGFLLFIDKYVYVRPKNEIMTVFNSYQNYLLKIQISELLLP